MTMMKRAETTLALALLGAFAVAPAEAQSPRDDLVVSAEWLMEHAGDPGLVILQAGGQDYASGHVPGARLLDLRRISISRGEMGAPGHLMLELPDDLSGVREAFEAVGVSDDSRIVVTFEGRGVANATRTLWTLQVLGLGDRASLLNGGNLAWQAAGGTLTDEVPDPEPARITTSPRLDRRVDGAFVQRRGQAAGVALLDARTAASFDGVQEEMPGRAGHIPGASNLHFRDLYDEETRLRSAGELGELFAGAGVEPGDTVVAYCHIGLWATNLVLAARTLGYEAVLYDGSMQAWAADPDLPLVTDPGR